MTRLLVVTPVFHGYGAAISHAFERLGYDVSIHHYDQVRGNALKVWNKVRHELPSKLTGRDEWQSQRAVEQRCVAAIRESRPDLVLVVRGDDLGPDFWTDASANGRRATVWLYDELRRTPRFDIEFVAQHAAIATYSRLDATALAGRGISAAYVPTGYDDLRPIGGCTGTKGLVNFVGAPLPGRVHALKALIDAGVPVRAWGRGWSDHPVDRARTWRVRKRGIPNDRDVPADVALAIMRDSSATLNVHGDQDGFTMRTFEACGAGGVQLIDRADVSEFYDPGSEVLVFQNDDELVDLGHRVVKHPDEFDDLRERAKRRTLAEHTFVHRARALEGLWS